MAPEPNDPIRIVGISDDVVDEIQNGLATPGTRMGLVNTPNAVAVNVIQAGLATPGDRMDLINAPNAVAITAIQAGLATGANLATVDGYTEKIDDLASDGLNGIEDSVAYRIHEIERHFHSYERWFETASVPNGEIHVADSIGSGNGAFQIDAGNDTWGGWVQILGSSDTPAIAGSAYFDPHRITIEATERNATYFVQLAFGASGAAALAAGTYTESVYIPATNQVEEGPSDIQSRRVATSTKVWARCMCPGQNTATLDFYIGIHEYEG